MSLSYKYVTKVIREYTRGKVYEFMIPTVEDPPYVYFEMRSEPVLSKDVTTQNIEVYDITFAHRTVHEVFTMADGFITGSNWTAGTEAGITIKRVHHVARDFPAQTAVKSKVVYKITDTYEIRI